MFTIRTLFGLFTAATIAIVWPGAVRAQIVSAATVNPCQHGGKTRPELAMTFPDLPAGELDKLLFRIVEVGCPVDRPAEQSSVSDELKTGTEEPVHGTE